MTYAYARISSRDQNLDRQLSAFRSFGIPPKHIFCDKKSGKRTGVSCLGERVLRFRHYPAYLQQGRRIYGHPRCVQPYGYRQRDNSARTDAFRVGVVADPARHRSDSSAHHHSVPDIAVYPQIPVLAHLSAVQGDSGSVQGDRQPTKAENGNEGSERTCRKAYAETARRCGRIGGVNENGQENHYSCSLGRGGNRGRLLISWRYCL